MKLKVLLPLCIAVIIVAGGGYYAYSQRNQQLERTDFDSKTDTQKQEQPAPKPNQADPTTDRDDDDDDEAVGSLQKPVITSIQQNGDTLTVRAVLNGIKSGSCTLTLTKGGKKVTQKAPIGLVTSYYTCQGFDVSTAKLSSGTWKAVIEVNSNGETAASESASVRITQ